MDDLSAVQFAIADLIQWFCSLKNTARDANKSWEAVLIWMEDYRMQ